MRVPHQDVFLLPVLPCRFPWKGNVDRQVVAQVILVAAEKGGGKEMRESEK